MEALFYLLVLFLLFWQWRAIRTLKNDVERTQERMRDVAAALDRAGITIAAEELAAETVPDYLADPEIARRIVPRREMVNEPETPSPVDMPLPSPPPAEAGIERQLGARLPVWIGGIALALAGFFLVRYSIENGLLGPAARIGLGLVFGAALLGAAALVRRRPGLADGLRIAQALSGAGIADLYVCLFAATSLYHFVPAWTGFLGMAGVTGFAVLWSLRYGLPIALLGFAGGFLTPALFHSNHPQAPVLFLYLYILMAGLLAAGRRRNWVLLAPLVLAASFLWVVFWLAGGEFAPDDGIWLGLFLLAVTGTVVGVMRDRRKAGPVGRTLPYAAFGGAAVLMAATTAQAGFGLADWGLFWLLAAASLVLARLDEDAYRWAPWISLASNGAMLAVWPVPAPGEYAAVLCGFAMLPVAGGWTLQWRSAAPGRWAGLSGVAGAGALLLGYEKLHDLPFATGLPGFWGVAAFVLATLAAAAAADAQRRLAADNRGKDAVIAIYAGAATACLSMGLAFILPPRDLSIAVAAEIAALAWIVGRMRVDAMRRYIAILAGWYAVLLLPQIMLLARLALFSVFEIKWTTQDALPALEDPLRQLIFPGFCFAVAARFLLSRRDGAVVRGIEAVAVCLFGAGGYYLIRHLFHQGHDLLFIPAGFVERGVVTNALFLSGLLILFATLRWDRVALRVCGFVLSGMAVLRIFYLDLMLHDPLWASDQDVGSVPILNGLALAFLLPALWCWGVAEGLRRLGAARWTQGTRGIALVLAFVWLTMTIRQCFHGHDLAFHGDTTNAEIYSYSTVWLIFGLALLLAGTYRRDRALRLGSLAVLITTVGKVFLYDAGALGGLYRVLSFFGLGICLMGLSWFYTRFVFGRDHSRS